jgi:xanthine dehydrogenase accessory factor
VYFYERIARLEGEHATFAIATVVGRRSPVSSHLGDRALIFPDGHMEGFVGGSCSRDIVRRQALDAIRRRRPRLLQIRPDAEPLEAHPHVDAEQVVIPMSCASEGAVDVYIEPRVPSRRLVVAGFTPVADALVRLASTLDYDVVRVVADLELGDVDATAGVRVIGLRELPAFLEDLPRDTRASLVAVVASQGHYDELVLEALLAHPPAFVGLLASRRRAATVFGVLRQQGLPAERLARIHNPVGLDIGARNPGEAAVSVLAEIIALAPHASDDDAVPVGVAARTASDPICGMEVDAATAQHHFAHDGTTYVFCCAGCRSTFAADPARYLTALGRG